MEKDGSEPGLLGHLMHLPVHCVDLCPSLSRSILGAHYKISRKTQRTTTAAEINEDTRR